MQTTMTYPTRYAAGQSQGEFVVQADLRRQGGYEWAVLSHDMQNPVYPHIVDGIYISISSYQTSHLILDCHASAPTRTRPQKNYSQKFAYEDFSKALSAGEAWYKEALAWLQTRL